jgi:hypothetical protein
MIPREAPKIDDAIAKYNKYYKHKDAVLIIIRK